jgi:predicted ester cyclase
MTNETDAALAAARYYVDTYNKCTTEFVDACLTDDMTAVAFPGGEVLFEGRAAWLAGAANMLRAIPDRQIEVQSLTVVGHWVSAHIVFSGTVAEPREGFPEPGERFSQPMLLLWQIQDGRLAAEHLYA